MTDLKINLFGEFRVRRGEDLIQNEEWDRQKTRTLLKLLLTRPGRIFSRDEIMEALWPDASPKAAERSLWVTVSLLRRALEPSLKHGSTSKYVLQRRPGYAFNWEGACWVDAWEFQKHCKKGETARETEKLDEAIREYRTALDLVQGEFLAEDPYEEWATQAREEWRERHLSALSGLAECLALKGRYTEAVELCEEALTLDGYREDTHRRLMLYHYCAGEQGLAVQAYRDYTKVLREELSATPSPELTRLKERIEARDVPGVDEMRRYPKPRRPLRFPYSLSRTHFVGRDREYALLAERVREATEGRGSAVAVEGEAGVGKTRLVEEFLGYARSCGALALMGRCYERELGAPLEPIVEAVDALVDIGSILSLGEAKVPKDPYHLAFQQGTTPRETTHFYRVLAGELIRRSRDTEHEVMVLFVEDVQWADPATLDFLSYLARRITNERILLLFTYRREDAPELSGWLYRLAERRAVTATLSLNRLTREDVAQILGRMCSRRFGKLPLLTRFLYRESEGNPFYAVEYLRWLIEAGIVQTDSRRRICALEVRAFEDSELPSGVRSLLQARLSDMDDETRNIMELAAIVGRSFDLGLLCEAASQGEPEIVANIRPAVASGFVVETPQEGYYFSHDKFRQALYEGIDVPRLRGLHLRVAQALEDTDVEPAELAYHYLRAGEWQPALENLVLAARKAEDGYAWETALENYARALKVAKKLSNSEERQFELLAARERLLEHLNRREERMETAEWMFELAGLLGDRARMAEVYIRRVGALAALGAPEDTAEAGLAAVTIFREIGDKAGEARAHREIGYVHWASGNYADALEESFEGLKIRRELGDRAGEAGAAGNIAQIYRSMGDHGEALRWAGKAVRLYRELGDKLGEGMRLTTMAAIHRERGDLKTALSLNLKTLRYNAEVGAKNLNVAQHNSCGTLCLRLGNPEEALKHFRSAARLAREIGYARDEGNSVMSVGVALEWVGDTSGAAETYRKAIELLDTAYEESGREEDLSAKVEALTLLAAVLHRSLDRPQEALRAYGTAVGIYRGLGDGRRLGKLLLSLAGLYWRAGKLEDSTYGYEEALELARKHGETAHEAAALASLSVVYRNLGRLKESLRRGREARNLLRGLQDLQAEAYVLASLADSYRALGYHPSALSCLKRSVRLRQQIGDTQGEAKALRHLAETYEKMGEQERALDIAEEAAQKEGLLRETR